MSALLYLHYDTHNTIAVDPLQVHVNLSLHIIPISYELYIIITIYNVYFIYKANRNVRNELNHQDQAGLLCDFDGRESQPYTEHSVSFCVWNDRSPHRSVLC